jgi:hypothetical protein
MRLNKITDFININKKLPIIVDSSNEFNWYKINNSRDITYDYFEHYDQFENIEYDNNILIKYHENDQFINYSMLDYKNILPIIRKYFSPSVNINNIIKDLENKYDIKYDNICVLFYRGNDKRGETTICEYDEYTIYANMILEKNQDIVFLIQSDETEFIEFILKTYPNNSFYFKDEIRHMNNCDRTVDHIMKDNIDLFSKYYLAITIIMSKCKFIICGSGNCSIWISFYRENCKNIYQNLNKEWISHIDL